MFVRFVSLPFSKGNLKVAVKKSVHYSLKASLSTEAQLTSHMLWM